MENVVKRYKIFIIVIIKIVLDYCYPLINTTFLYNFNNPINLNKFKYFESFFLMLIVFKYIYRIKNDVINDLLLLLFVLNYIPLTTIYFYLDESRIFIYIITICYLLSIFIYKLFLGLKIQNKSKIEISNEFIKNINLLLLLLFIIICYFKFGSPKFIDAFHLKKLYVIRENNKFSQWLSYNFIFLIYFSIPFLLNFYKKETMKIIMISSATILIYIYNPKKIILAYLIIYIILIYIRKINIIISIVSFCTIFLLLARITQKIFYIGMSDRIFYLPAVLTYKYYDFFSKNNFNLFNNSKLGIFFPKISDYGMEYTYYISEYYYNSPMNANANYLASSYAEGGILIMLISSVLLGLILTIIGRVSSKIDSKLIMILVLPNILMLTNGPIWLIFLSNGFALTLIYFINIKKEEKECK